MSPLAHAMKWGRRSGSHDRLILALPEASHPSKRRKPSLREFQHARQMQTIVSIVSAGLGIALIPSALTKLQREGVRYQALKEASPQITLGVMHRSGDNNPAVRNFIALAAHAVRLAR